MGGQPYLYDPAPKFTPWDPYNGFNPKAVSQASLAPKPPPPKQPEGPLLTFNRHPDSYLVMPGTKEDVKPMHPSTRKRVTRAIIAQMVMRGLQLVGTIGILICVICVRTQEGKTQESLVIRIPVRYIVAKSHIDIAKSAH